MGPGVLFSRRPPRPGSRGLEGGFQMAGGLKRSEVPRVAVPGPPVQGQDGGEQSWLKPAPRLSSLELPTGVRLLGKLPSPSRRASPAHPNPHPPESSPRDQGLGKAWGG